eukprot:TRINITY_DN7154_c0_g1_i1.p1 TRINITY_DN7154_c0_g1~~TRINITY_DN7154_c0_g1_i1.p1  ORF type:complete len:474 (+),score=157.86 TRINITY_DN7154_c0_g1_i1:127-1548(+)
MWRIFLLISFIFWTLDALEWEGKRETIQRASSPKSLNYSSIDSTFRWNLGDFSCNSTGIGSEFSSWKLLIFNDSTKLDEISSNSFSDRNMKVEDLPLLSNLTAELVMECEDTEKNSEIISIQFFIPESSAKIRMESVKSETIQLKVEMGRTLNEEACSPSNKLWVVESFNQKGEQLLSTLRCNGSISDDTINYNCTVKADTIYYLRSHFLCGSLSYKGMSVNSTDYSNLLRICTPPLNSQFFPLQGDILIDKAEKKPSLSIVTKNLATSNSNLTSFAFAWTTNQVLLQNKSLYTEIGIALSELTFDFNEVGNEGVIDSRPLSTFVTFTFDYSSIYNINSTISDADAQRLDLFYWEDDKIQNVTASCPRENQLNEINVEEKTWRINVCHLTQFTPFLKAVKTRDVDDGDGVQGMSQGDQSSFSVFELSDGQKAGIALGVIGFIVLVVLVVTLIVRHRIESQKRGWNAAEMDERP